MSDLMNKIKAILADSGVEHEFIALPEDIGMDVKAHMRFHGNELKYAMPNIVFKTEKGLIVVQRRGDTPIDNKKLKKLVGVQRLSLASEEDLRSLGLEPGIVPPLGYQVPFYIDQKVLENKEIYTGTGDKLFALKLSPRDLVELNNAMVGDFTQGAGNRTGGRVLSGIRANGKLHLGNYLGAVKGMLALQDNPEYETFYMVADLHSINVPYNPKTFPQAVREVVLDYLAAGLDPQKSTIFIQSHVPEHVELSYLFSTAVTVARMQHLPTFKEKVKNYPENVNMALLYYPVLMAADILVYGASLVPVGIDQEPHLEVAREVAQKMNDRYGLKLPEPQRFATAGEYVPSLTGEGKMAKSVEGSAILLTDDMETIKERLARVPTDSGKGESVPKEGGVASLLKFAELFLGDERVQELKEQYTTNGIRYGDLKAEIAEAIFAELKPIQQRRADLEADTEKVDRIISEGAQKARKAASQTVSEVKKAMGLL